MARHGRRGGTRLCRAWRGKARLGLVRQERCGFALRGLARRCGAWLGAAWQAGLCPDRPCRVMCGDVRCGLARQAGPGKAWRGAVGSGKVGQEPPAMHGAAGEARQGVAWPGRVRHGYAWLGMAVRGRNGLA